MGGVLNFPPPPVNPVKVDPLTGTGWTTSSTSGGASRAWTSGTRLRITVPASTVGYVDEDSSTLLKSKESWDLAARIQHITGDGSNRTRISLTVGIDGNNKVSISMWGDGTMEMGRVEGGSYLSAGFQAGASAGQRTGGQLWLRLVSSGGVVRSFWGVGSAGQPPTSWTFLYAAADAVYAKVSYGDFVRLTALTLDTSLAGGYVADYLDIRTNGLLVGSLT